MTTALLDDRLRAGFVSVADLAVVFVEHWPGERVTDRCPSCGYTYSDAASECPSLALARRLLARRRFEDIDAVPEWVTRVLRQPSRSSRASRTPPRGAGEAEPAGLFELAGGDGHV